MMKVTLPVLGLALTLLHPMCVIADEATADSEPVARQAGVSVSVDDLYTYLLDRVPAARRREFLGRPEELLKLAESLLTVRVLAAEARETDWVDLDEIEKRLDFARDRMIAQAYMDAYAERETLTADWEAVARERYLANRESFKAPERVSAAHILLSTESRSEEEARDLAEQLMSRLESGEAFGDLAVEYSDDASAASNRGELGVFSRGRMVPAFEQAVFELREPGATIGPVKTQFGFHIIRLHEYFPPRVRDFEEVRESLVKDARQSLFNDVKQRKLIELRSSQAVEINAEDISSLREAFLERLEDE